LKPGIVYNLEDDAEAYLALLVCSGSRLSMRLLCGLGLFGRLFLPKEQNEASKTTKGGYPGDILVRVGA